jgi:phenylacetate-coenzyme A ligase PaaK-like adenylate-forming protein
VSAAGRARAALLRGLLLPLGDLAFGQRMTRRLRFLEEAQWWDAERVARERDRLARETVAVAYREVPFWRAHLDAAGLAPGDVRGAADLARIPPVDKAMLRAGFPHRVTRPTGQRTWVAATSGSTGSNFRVLEDAYTAGWYRASLLLALGWAGWRVGEAHLQTGMTLERTGERRLKDALLRCHYVSAYDLRPEAVDRALETLERRRIRFLFGYPASLWVLARRARELGWNRPLAAAATWGDMLYPHYRREVEAAFGTRVFDVYGIAEGTHIAAQCGCGPAYHLHAFDVVVDILDDAGAPAPAGTPGHLVVTRLHPGPMPLVRYRVGDVAALPAGDGSGCGCGRAWPRLEGIQGRDTDVVLTPGGNRLIVHFFTGILEHFPEIRDWQVVQREADAVVLRVVPGPGFSSGAAARAVEALRAHGADLHVEVETVDEIPLPPTGKRRFILSEYARQRGWAGASHGGG